MTTKLFEAYKRGNYKPYIRYSIELFQPMWIKETISDSNPPYYRVTDNNTYFLPIRDTNIVKIEFKKNDIIYTFKDEHSFWNAEKKYPFFKNFGNKTINVNYKNIKRFN